MPVSSILSLAAAVLFLLTIWMLYKRTNRQPSESERRLQQLSQMPGEYTEAAKATLEELLLKSASQAVRFNLANDVMARTRIHEAAGKASEELDANGSATVELPFLHADSRGPRHFKAVVRRDQFGRVSVELQA